MSGEQTSREVAPRSGELATNEVTAAELERALAGEEMPLRHLLMRLTPVIQARITRSLLRYEGGAGQRDIGQEVDDLTQEIFVALFAEGGKILRQWQPERGLSLRNFVGLVAERRVLSQLRSARRNPWTESPTEAERLEGSAVEASPERQSAARLQLRRLLRRFKEELSPLGWHVFDLLFLRQQTVPEVERHTGLSPDAIYAWRSRLRRLARHLQKELELGHPQVSGRTEPLP